MDLNSYKCYRLNVVYPLISLAAFLLVCISVLVCNTPSPHIRDITYLWETQPIVSIYVPTTFQGAYCAQGFQPVPINNYIKSIGESPCGCAQNAPFTSSNDSCTYNAENSNDCISLPTLIPQTNQIWRENIICIKRAGKPAANFDYDKKYRARPHPNKEGYCPKGFRKCGEGFNQQDAAICFPTAVECPITNVLMLPSSQSIPTGQGWESAGEFASSNQTLYVRREHWNEFPVVDLVFQLTEFNNKGDNLRGRCYGHPSQVINDTAFANPERAFSYDIRTPAVCNKVDARYLLLDQVPLQEHFLLNLQLTEPACERFALYPLSDPQYQAALDPDYLNSDVKCDFTSMYTCVRDPYQRTDCAAGDNICDGVIHQNVCGEYTHAVRSAIPAQNSVTLGMYIAREIQWTDGCEVGKSVFYMLRPGFMDSVFGSIVLTIGWCFWNIIQLTPKLRAVRFMWDYQFYLVLLVFTQITFPSLWKLAKLNIALQGGNCTDPFTTDAMLSQLESFVATSYLATTITCIILLLTLESFILAMVTMRYSVVVQIYYLGGLGSVYQLAPIGTNPIIFMDQPQYPPLFLPLPAADAQATVTTTAAATTHAVPATATATAVRASAEPTMAEAVTGWNAKDVQKNSKEYPTLDWV